MSIPFYDTHAHLDYPEFAGDFSEILERAQTAGITRMICIGTDLESSRKAIELAERHTEIYAAVGWHPTNAPEAPEDLRPALRELGKHPKVVTIGETGLDYYRMPSTHQGGTPEDDLRYKQQQARIFHQQLEVAADLGLNCVIHQRDVENSRAAFEDILQMLKPYEGKVRGQFHCFAGDAETMREILSIGSVVSFTGIATFKNAQQIRDTIKATPLGQFMLETDCPYLAPVPYRGKRCEPAYVKEISVVAAQAKGCSLEELSQATCALAHEFFPKLR